MDNPLRAADALQLAAAFLAAERRPPSLELSRSTSVWPKPREGFELIEVTEICSIIGRSARTRVGGSSAATTQAGANAHPVVASRRLQLRERQRA
jgi:hypothetical protein